MIFVSAQPDELQFAWQTEVQLKNFKSLGIDLSKVYVLVGCRDITNPLVSDASRWDRCKKYGANIEYYPDLRETKFYAPSIRPYLLGEFFKKHEDLQEEYMFYYDSDIVLTEVPAFEAMQDYRWHVSHADYISWNYIEEKKSPTLMRDMLSAVGLPEQVAKDKGQNVGGVQYFIYGTTPAFWKKVEQDCERMWKTYHSNFNIYRREYYDNVVVPQHDKNPGVGGILSFEQWSKDYTAIPKHTTYYNSNNELIQPEEGSIPFVNYYPFDFQAWCTDMWCIYWNALLFGTDVYVNPELSFIWPKDPYNNIEIKTIYHDSGIGNDDKDKWFVKGNYKTKTPFGEDLTKLGYYSPEIPGAQRFYLDIIQSIREEIVETKDFDSTIYPLVSCVMTTYGRFECVERSIALWLLQDYENKELIIFNTAEVPLELDERLQNKGIRVINQQTLLGTNTKFTDVGQIRAEAFKAILGKYWICWDDDDLYFPFHISQGVNYLLSTGKKAYMPKRSYWSPDAGGNFEYAQNAMEAACIVDADEIRRYGFISSNGGEHGTWRKALADSGELREDNDVYPFESYVYLWGEEIASHKQSGSIDNPNCFEEHKAKSTDFGVRPLSLYSPLRIKLWFQKLINFANNPQLTERMKQYV